MSYTRALRILLAVMIVSALMPLGTASAARNRAPRILKAVMKDTNGNGLADRVVLTYSEKVRHKADFSKFPFVVQGYRIAKIGAVSGKNVLGIALTENANAPKKPASIKYTRTRKQPVLDLKRMQAAKQLLTKNIIGLPVAVQEHTLTVAKSGDGVGTVRDDQSKIDCGTACSAKYPAGTSVTLTATPDATTKATFAGWTGCSSTTTTCTVTLDADKTVTAAFAKAGTFALTVSKAGDGLGTVTSTSSPSQPTQINCGATCVASFPKDAVVTLTAAPDQQAGSKFAGFTGGGCTGTATTCNVTMDAAKAVTATFNKATSFALSVAKAGASDGSVTSTSSPAQPGQINCGAKCSESYPAGTQVTLTATPPAGTTFAGFSGGGCSGSSASCVVLVDSAKTVTATFNAATKHTLQIQKTGTGTVKSTSNPTQPAQIDCGATCSADFPSGTTVTLTATPGENFTFAGWSGGSCTGASTTCNVTMDGAKTITATFNAVTAGTNHQLSASAVNGSVACLADNGGTSCTGPYPAGTKVTMTALPGVGMDPSTATWTGCTAPVGSLTCTVTMDAAKVVTVSFAAPAVPQPLTDTTTNTTDLTGGLPLNVQP